MDKDITQSTFLQYVKPINFKKVFNFADELNIDKYSKKLTTKDIDGKIVKDSTIYLGKENTTKMENKLRLIEIPDDQNPDKIIRIVTNDMKISNLYRNRWQIELFSKWIKQHLHVR